MPFVETIRPFVTNLAIRSCWCLYAAKRPAVTWHDGLCWKISSDKQAWKTWLFSA